MSDRKLQAELFLRNDAIRITNDEHRAIGELLYKYYYRYGSVNEFETGGMKLRIKQRDISPDKLFGPRLKGKTQITKLWLFCNDEKLITLRVFNFYGTVHQSIHINESYEYFDEIIFYMNLLLN